MYIYIKLNWIVLHLISSWNVGCVPYSKRLFWRVKLVCKCCQLWFNLTSDISFSLSQHLNVHTCDQHARLLKVKKVITAEKIQNHHITYINLKSFNCIIWTKLEVDYLFGFRTFPSLKKKKRNKWNLYVRTFRTYYLYVYGSY